MENKRTNIIIILLATIIVLLVVILCVVLINKPKDKPLPKEEDIVDKEPTEEEILTSIVGEWGRCNEDKSCYGIVFSKKNDKFTYSAYLMWSEGTPAGDITRVEKKDKNIYEITVHFDAYENEFSSGPESTSILTIDVSEVSSNILTIDNKRKYQKITGDREEFFNSIM